MFTVLQHPARLRLQVHVQPRAPRNRVAGTHGGALKVQIAAAPVEGAANAALIDLLAKVFGVPRSGIRVLSGAHGRKKTVEVIGGDADSLRRRAEAVLGHPTGDATRDGHRGLR